MSDEQWQVDMAMTDSDRKAGRVSIGAYTPIFDRRTVAVFDHKEDAEQIVSDHAIAQAARAYREAYDGSGDGYWPSLAALFAVIDGAGTSGEGESR